MSFRMRSRDQRGAILAHVAGIILVLIIFTSLVFDYGVQLVGRNQVQNAADAAAHAAAVSLSFVSTNQGVAQSAAIAAAQQNQIWGGAPDVLSSDITFPPCPPGSPGAGVASSTCVRAEVFRTNYQRANGSPLPTFFASLVGLNEQGVRATATAEVLRGAGTAECVKPVAIPDKWIEARPTPVVPWNPVTSVFERYQMNGNGAGSLLTPADEYVPPTSSSDGSGFTVANDYGTQLILKNSNPQNAIDPGFFYPVRIDPNCTGGNCYRDAWAGCSGVAIGPGNVLYPEPGNMIGPTAQGVDDLIALDASATWDTSANGGRGGPVGGCMAAGTCARSPRWIAVPIFNVDQYQYARATGGGGAQVPINIIKVLGFWLENRQGNDIYGRIMFYPTTSVLNTNNYTPSALAATQIVLVR